MKYESKQIEFIFRKLIFIIRTTKFKPLTFKPILKDGVAYWIIIIVFHESVLRPNL